MSNKIFRYNLLSVIDEIRAEKNILATENLMFKIIAVNEPGKPLTAIDDQMRLIALSEKNIGSRLLSFDETVNLLSCNSPLVPIWIEVAFLETKNSECIFELRTSLRFRNPSLLNNVETGHPPFKAVF